MAALFPFAARGQTAIPPRTLAVLVTDSEVAASDFDHPIWRMAPAASDLYQQEPVEGAPATLRTECRVVATPQALVLRFVMVEPAEEFVAHELRRDADLSADDRVAFVLDTHHDRRNAYFFATNPNGARDDGLVIEEAAPSFDWDAVWDVRTRRTPAGWDALFRIPWAALSFPGGPGEIWGFNFSRLMPRRTETVRWSGWRRPFALSKISLAGELTGLPALPARRLLEISPYGALRPEWLQNPSSSRLLGRAGLDGRLGISSATEADVTVNTDFAETEADAPQFNFGRTSLFFPEKRSFFLQRSSAFAFGSANTTLPFFSRRIGLARADTASPTPVPIDAGLKLTGRMGRSDFGALAVQTRADAGEPRSDFFVARVKEDLGHSSYLGALFTDVERPGSDPGGSYSRAAGADAGISLTPEWNAAGFYAQTRNPGVSGETSAWDATLAYNGEWAQGRVERANVGSSFDPRTGFVSQSGIHWTLVDFMLVPRPRISGLKDLNLETFYSFRYNENGTLFEREYQYTFRAEWQNGAYSDDDIVDVFDENLTAPLVLTDRVAIPPGLYHFVRHQITYGSNPSRPFSFQTNFNFGGYYGGRRNRYVGRVFWKPNEHVGLSVIEDYNAVRLPQGDFNLSLFSARLDWNASVRLLSSLIVQSDNVDRLTHVQAIFRWLIDPATDLFAVYDRQIGAGFERPGSRVTVKFRRTFDL